MTQTKAQERKYILLSHEEWAEKMKIEWGRQLERGGSEYESVWWNVSIIYEEQASSSWGDWHFDKKSLHLDLLPSHSSTNGQLVIRSRMPEDEINIFFRILEHYPFSDINWVTESSN